MKGIESRGWSWLVAGLVGKWDCCPQQAEKRVTNVRTSTVCSVGSRIGQFNLNQTAWAWRGDLRAEPCGFNFISSSYPCCDLEQVTPILWALVSSSGWRWGGSPSPSLPSAWCRKLGLCATVLNRISETGSGWSRKEELYCFAGQRGPQRAPALENYVSQPRGVRWGVLWRWFKGGVADKIRVCAGPAFLKPGLR